MTDWLDISPECGEDCRVIMAKPMRWRAAEINVGAGQPVAEPQVADAGRSEPQDVADDRKDSAIFRVELEERQPDFTTLNQGDEGTIAGHGPHGAFRVIRFDTQKRAGLRRVDQIDAGQEARRDADFVRGVSRRHAISPWERPGSASRRS
ncbi:hypothetical protein Pden_1371 [Paracoccus denitrificans PD1222]|uniref:Uncharacterized protein n=1 Tax=Paracoccus denitrificans (strain Pd 1222) TaxID=318586 RepID=A1B1S8_PARDP|nr:hypothetical protein Pden_1371 [Paracoccus denitrificans PD1222]